MEEVLNSGLLLESLDSMLNNSDSESSKTEFSFPDMRLRTARSVSSGSGSRSRNESSPSTSSCFIPTKENALNQSGPGGGGRAMLYCAAGSNKMHFRRHKHRPCPYDINKRKPLNSLLNPMGRLGMGLMGYGNGGVGPGTATRVRSSDSYSESRSGIDHDHNLPLFDEEYHDLPFREGLSYSKTDKFPVSILSRSKSLEDLRESPNKSGGIKQVRFKLVCYDDNSNGTLSSNGSNSLESPLSVSPRTSFFNVLRGEASIKSEIDSMSMLIEKLDVA